jgi:hypothetical protein
MNEIECALQIVKNKGRCFLIRCAHSDICPLDLGQEVCTYTNAQIFELALKYVREHKDEAMEILL